MQIEIIKKGYFHSISQFKLIKDLGVGTFGKVKLAIHIGTHRQYAIKIIDLIQQLNDLQLQIIIRQIKIHSKLDHPHIIKLWDTLINDNKIYMIMDFAKYGSLFKYHSQLLHSGTQPTSKQIYQFFYQTLQALKYLHSNDLMHRDIKPENLLLDQNLNIKLCDFGWATNHIHSQRTTFCGTYQYMAPEMALQKSYDYRIDIWALGVLLYQLVHGKAPFQAQNLKIIKQRINKGSYQINSQCSSNLKSLIVDILQFLPQKRLSIAQIQQHSWVQSHQNIQSPPNQLSINQLISPSQDNNQNPQIAPTSNVKKHFLTPSSKFKKHHQKSMGNFLDLYKNNFIGSLDLNNNRIRQPILNTITQTQINKSQRSLLNKPDTHKKHKRNITQPTDQYVDKQKSHQKFNLKNNKSKILFTALQTQADTPYPTQQLQPKNGSLVIKNKKKQKCKTQIQQQLITSNQPYINNITKKYLFDTQQLSQIKKLKKIQTQPQQSNQKSYISSPLHFLQKKNDSKIQLKQNDINFDSTQKIKRKIKAQDKFNTLKNKKYQQKLFQNSNPFYFQLSPKQQKIVTQ